MLGLTDFAGLQLLCQLCLLIAKDNHIGLLAVISLCSAGTAAGNKWVDHKQAGGHQ
jgi:hypothetical protein